MPAYIPAIIACAVPCMQHYGDDIFEFEVVQKVNKRPDDFPWLHLSAIVMCGIDGYPTASYRHEKYRDTRLVLTVTVRIFSKKGLLLLNLRRDFCEIATVTL